MISRLGICSCGRSPPPLSWIHGLGSAVGRLLYALVSSRRQVVDVNLRLCFPHWSEDQRRRVARETFVHVAQAWFDRAWLWHGDPDLVRRRLLLTGAVPELSGQEPTILFCPHFVGLDAGVTTVSQQLPRRFVGIYTRQSNPVIDAWVLQGRYRFGDARPMSRRRACATSSLRCVGGVLYRGRISGAEDSIFVPFRVPAAPCPRSRARLGEAKVVR
jgi:KDO2-lipid IV(A) lauroyltransferase